MKIFLCGTHSCGKTTLAREIASRHKFTLVEESAREIIVEGNVDLSTFSRDVIAADKFQETVARSHIHKAEHAPKGDVVFDRGLDFLVYSSMFSTGCQQQYDKYFWYIERFLKAKDSRVFVLDPHEAMMKDDGARKSLDMVTAWSITNGIILLLEIHDVPYIRLTTHKLLDRIKTVDAVIKWEKSGRS